jgi:hypothetical protein
MQACFILEISDIFEKLIKVPIWAVGQLSPIQMAYFIKCHKFVSEKESTDFSTISTISTIRGSLH